ncbi:MAG: tetratricopeptide repeat protein [Candidatus Schekmanbacteria bacterium]|nr:tetratricopeptide repeat protein [Candidatus Schekmanbacteria bacterium]
MRGQTFRRNDPRSHQALDADSADIEVQTDLAFAYLEANRLDEAKTILFKVLATSPTRSSAWLSLGQVLAQLGERDQAGGAFLNDYRLSGDSAKTITFLEKLSTGSNVLFAASKSRCDRSRRFSSNEVARNPK